MKLEIESEREADGRWIAEAVDVAGAMCYEMTQELAVRQARLLALEIIADRLLHGESIPGR